MNVQQVNIIIQLVGLLLIAIKYMTKFIKNIVIALLLSGILLSCSNKKKSISNIPSNKIELSTKETKFPPSDVLNLESYYLSSSCMIDSTIWIVSYNYRMHALDFINLKTKKITQTELEKEGDGSIQRPVGLYMHNTDSIWICDQAGYFILINKNGIISQKKQLNNTTTNSNEKVMVITNHAMYTSKLYYNKKRMSLFYLVQKENSFYAKECFCDSMKRPNYYPLALPYTTNKKISINYGYMNGVNISFTDNYILYNYPIESVFYVYNIQSKENKLIKSYSAYTKNFAEPFKPTNDYSKWEKHGLENPHFYEIMYLPKQDIYMRLHIKETEFNKTKSATELSDDRELYLTCWDKSFNFLYEEMLSKHRYNYCTGWCSIYNGLLLYVNNITSKKEFDDLLTIDIIKPKSKTK